MKCAVCKGKNVPDPRIEAPADAIVRITTAAICGAGLHIYEERSKAAGGDRTDGVRGGLNLIRAIAW
jgi:threonine dehydrogenase-like Zn-dependent dehydrogenase